MTIAGWLTGLKRFLWPGDALVGRTKPVILWETGATGWRCPAEAKTVFCPGRWSFGHCTTLLSWLRGAEHALPAAIKGGTCACRGPGRDFSSGCPIRKNKSLSPPLLCTREPATLFVFSGGLAALIYRVFAGGHFSYCTGAVWPYPFAPSNCLDVRSSSSKACMLQ